MFFFGGVFALNNGVKGGGGREVNGILQTEESAKERERERECA